MLSSYKYSNSEGQGSQFICDFVRSSLKKLLKYQTNKCRESITKQVMTKSFDIVSIFLTFKKILFGQL